MVQMHDSSGSFKATLPAVIFVTAIFFCNFLSRVVLAPLMPVIQKDLGFTHSGAGHLFLALATGNAIGLLLSGFISRELDHRRTVGISCILVGLAALAAPMAQSYAMFMAGMVALGLAVGVYLPSGISAITSLVRNRDWGKALAVHELAPNLSYVVAPLLAEFMLMALSWRYAFITLGVLQLLLGVWFLKQGRGGEFPGIVPNPAMVRQILGRPIFWLLALFFSMAVGCSIGPYSMLPLYLVDDHGYTREAANQLLAVSRVMAVFMPFGAGYITDRWGAKKAIFLYLMLCGSALVVLGFASGNLLVAMVLAQPVFSVLMFAPGFTLLSLLFDPAQRSVAVALIGPINAVVGLGLVPTFLGHMGDAGMFSTGFLCMGGILLAIMGFLPFLPDGRAGQE